MFFQKIKIEVNILINRKIMNKLIRENLFK